MSGQREKSAGRAARGGAQVRMADVAHELRSPLGGIDAMIELLAGTRTNADQERLIAGLRAASAHMRAVASEVIGSGRGGRRGEPVSVGEMMADFAVAAGARARARELLYVEDVSIPCETALVADGVALRQMLENLIDNAFRFTARGVVSARVTPVLDAAGAPQVRFEILDEGEGLSDAEMAEVFGRGVTFGKPGAGAGLGLSIVSRLAATLGGSCGVSRRTDKPGASFWFTLPVVGYREQPAPEQTGNAGPKARATILIVDDDATSRLLMTTVLDHLGFDTEATGSPTQALDRMAERSFAAVFTDMSMPEMDGCALISAIRALPNGGLPIVAVTGRVMAGDKAALTAAGCDDIVEKPVTIHDLRQALRRADLIPVVGLNANAA
jgi:CheY-like chemotaxis protein